MDGNSGQNSLEHQTEVFIKDKLTIYMICVVGNRRLTGICPA